MANDVMEPRIFSPEEEKLVKQLFRNSKRIYRRVNKYLRLLKHSKGYVKKSAKYLDDLFDASDEFRKTPSMKLAEKIKDRIVKIRKNVKDAIDTIEKEEKLTKKVGKLETEEISGLQMETDKFKDSKLKQKTKENLASINEAIAHFNRVGKLLKELHENTHKLYDLIQNEEELITVLIEDFKKRGELKSTKDLQDKMVKQGYRKSTEINEIERITDSMRKLLLPKEKQQVSELEVQVTEVKNAILYLLANFNEELKIMGHDKKEVKKAS